jgi:hypothetical protein
MYGSLKIYTASLNSMPKYLIQKATLPVVALLMLASGCQPSTTPPVASTSPAATASATPSAAPTTPAASATPSASATPTTAASGTFTAQSLAGEYTMILNDDAKKEMEKSGIKEFKAKITLSADGTFEGALMISGAPPDAKEPKTSEVKAKGEFKVEGNTVVMTTKSQMVDGKDEKASPAADKYTISADGKELKPEAQGQQGISFVRK